MMKLPTRIFGIDTEEAYKRVMEEPEKQEIKQEYEEINEEYVYFYEMTLSNPDLTFPRKTAYRNSYRTFIINLSEENYRNDPELYEGLLEE